MHQNSEAGLPPVTNSAATQCRFRVNIASLGHGWANVVSDSAGLDSYRLDVQKLVEVFCQGDKEYAFVKKVRLNSEK